MKSLKESLIFELNSSTYVSAHDKEVARNGKETNRSRRFAVGAGKALTAELKKNDLFDEKDKFDLERLELYNKIKNKLKPNNNKELRLIIWHNIIEHGYNCDLNDIDVSNVTDMSWLFLWDVLHRFNGDISKWDVSNVTDMSSMFYDTSFNGDISKWDVSNVKDMSFMFGESKFNNDISSWDVSKVENMSNMFIDSTFNKNISNWNVDKVTVHDFIFFNCPIDHKPNMQPKFKK
jgi:surface protein